MTMALLSDLASHDPGIRKQAAKQLRRLWGAKLSEREGLVEDIAGALTESNWKMAKSAAEALGELQHPAAVDPLIVAFLESQWPVPKAAASALERIDGNWTASPLVQSALPELTHRLRSERWFVRERAAWALGKVGDHRSVEPLRAALEDEEESVRRAAARALQKIDVTVSTGSPSEATGEDPASATRDLIALTKSRVRGVRRRAVLALGTLARPEALPVLREALTDLDDGVRQTSAAALQSIGWSPRSGQERARLAIALEDWDTVEKAGEESIQPVMELLRAPTLELRRKAATTLGKVGDSRAVPALLEALQDSDDGVRQSAVHALDRLRWTPRDGRETALLALSWHIWEGAAAVGEDALGVLLESLQNADSELRTMAAKALGAIGDPASSTHLAEALDDPDWHVAEEALDAIVRVGGPESAAALAAALATQSTSARRRSLEALGRIGHPAAIEEILSMLGDKDLADVASSTLVQIDAPESVPLLRSALQSESSQVRAHAATILAKVADHRAIPSLLRGLDDTSLEVRETVGPALLALGWRPRDGRDRVLLAIALGIGDVNLDTEPIDMLSSILATGQELLRQKAAALLGTTGRVQAVQPLVRALKDRSEAVRIVAARALTDLHHPLALEPLFDAFVGDSWRVGSVALDGLASIDSAWATLDFATRVVPALLKDLADRSPPIRRRAARALGEIRPPQALPLLVSLLKDPESEVRAVAAQALLRVGDTSVVGPLIAALESESDWGAERALLASLRAIGDAAAVSRAQQIVEERRELTHSDTVMYARLDGGGYPIEQAKREIEVSAFYPNAVEPGAWSPVIGYISLRQAWGEILSDAETHLGQLRAKMRQFRVAAREAIEEGTAITVKPVAEGAVFNPPHLTIGFFESWHRFDFRFRAEENRLGETVDGLLTFSSGSVIIADVPLSVRVEADAEGRFLSPVRARIYEAIFASYSHLDSK